jgi:Baseplate J-like protein
MPTLPTQSFATMVANTVAQIQGNSSRLINFAVGSTLRAVVEGFAGLFLWFQAQVLQLILAIRLATSVGTDVDTWTADFMPIIPGSQTTTLPNGSPRLGAQPSTGLATFSRFTAAPVALLIPAAASITYTNNGNGTFTPVVTNAGSLPPATAGVQGQTVSFAVVVDTANTAYSPSLGGYVIPSGVTSVTIPVQALTPGSVGNISVGALTVLSGSNVPVGIDAVTNSAAFDNGVNQETDAQLKARFPLFLQTLRQGTAGAIEGAVAGIQVGMQTQILNCEDPSGSTDFGAFTVFVDDGTGDIPAATLALASAAIFAIAAAGTRPIVQAATALLVSPSAVVTVAPGFNQQTVLSQVVAVITAGINGTGLGNTLSYLGLISQAFAIPGVTDITSYTLNSLTGDIVPGLGQTIKTGTVTVS